MTTLHAIRVPRELLLSAAERLVAVPDRARAARALLDNARLHGIDPTLMWGIADTHEGAPFVRQAVLVVPTAGRTGMLFLSSPRNERRFGSRAAQTLELALCLRTACDELAHACSGSVSVGQALIEPGQSWADHACRDAGMTWVGELRFLRLPWSGASATPHDTAWPDGFDLELIRDPTDFGAGGDGAALEEALDGSYHDTLDCPELCGLRTTRDVIASHMGSQWFEPMRWWLLRRDGRAAGCCLLNLDATGHALELVYLGLTPQARGRGLGSKLLRHALAHAHAPDAREITCAVDTRNTPALKIYHDMGFRAFSSRIGFVRAIAPRIIELKPIADAARDAVGTVGGQQKVQNAKRL